MSQYKVQLVSGDEIIFKLISAEDCDRFYQEISKNDNPHVEEYLFNYITDKRHVGEDGNIDLPAGIIPTIIYYCLKLSGVYTTELGYLEAIESARLAAAKNPYNALYCTILRVFPQYKPEELKEMSLTELIDKIVLIEMMVGKPVIDTKKQREAIESKAEKAKPGSTKKGVAGITKDELASLQAALGREEHWEF